jgi:hypothetical protein
MASKDRTITIYHNNDNHRLLHDLHMVTSSEIGKLRKKTDKGADFTAKDMKSYDMCLDGLKKLVSIEKDLKSDKIASMTDEELDQLASKAIKERRAAARTRDK